MFDGQLTSPKSLETAAPPYKAPKRKASAPRSKKSRAAPKALDTYDQTEVQTHYPKQMISELRARRQKIDNT